MIESSSWCSSQVTSSALINESECDGDIFQIQMQKDNSQPWFKFVVKGQNAKGKFQRKIMRGNLKQPNEYTVTDICVPKDECYQLTLRDMGNDGLCCDYGIGFYKIFKNGKQVEANTMENKKRKRVKFGNSC